MVLVSFVSYGQTKKPIQSSSPSVQTLALNWFKTKYVDITFKDPYSYKLLKVLVEPINNDKYVTDEYLKILDSVVTRDSSILKYNVDSSLFKMYQRLYDNDKKNYEFYMSKGTTYTNMANVYKNSMESNLGNMKSYSDRMERENKEHNEDVKNKIIEWNNQNERYSHWKKEIESLTEKDKKHIVYHRIYLDCYANNSYGNPILGRYSFEFFYLSKNGYNVIKLNE